MTVAPPPLMHCKECGEPFYLTRPDREYCSETCRNTHNQRRITGGLKLYDLAMRWRIERPRGALGDLTHAADLLAQDERERRAARKAVIEEQRKAVRHD